MVDLVSKSISKVDKKFLEYEYVEQRIICLTSPFSGFQPLVPNQRCYFGANTKLRGKRIVGIDVMCNTTEFTYNGGTVLANTALPLFMLTIIDKYGNEAIKDVPMTQLSRFFNNGKIRVFNIEQNLEESYIISSITVPFANRILLFNFYTVNW